MSRKREGNRGRPAPEPAQHTLREVAAPYYAGPPAADPGDDLGGLMESIADYVQDLGRGSGLPQETTEYLSELTLLSAYPAVREMRAGDTGTALDLIGATWERLARQEMDGSDRDTAGTAPGPDERESLAAFTAAVAGRILRGELNRGGRQVLQRLALTLDLSFGELGRMFHVADETVRRWERGTANIPSVRLAALTAADAALDRLLGLFRAERLAAAVRRPAELFDGERAIDWILRGKIEEVAARYDRALLYQA